MQDLRGKVALVTGGASGIGRGIANALAHEGVHVAIADIEPDPAEMVASELRGFDVRSLAIPTDVSEQEAVESALARAEAQLGPVSVLCNNAGVYTTSPIAQTPEENFAWLLAVNLQGVINGVRAFLPRVQGRGVEAHIVNTASAAGLFAFPSMGAYVASKFAIVGYSEVLRQELEPERIGVSVLCPGGVRTRIGEAARNRQARFGGPLPTQASQSPGAGALEPIEVGRMVVRGIKENRLFIHTDLGMRLRYEERFARILADFAPFEEPTPSSSARA